MVSSLKKQQKADGRPPVNIAIFASGTGSNARQIISYFKESLKIKISLIVCNNPTAGVIDIAAEEHIPVLHIKKSTFMESGNAVSYTHLRAHETDSYLVCRLLL